MANDQRLVHFPEIFDCTISFLLKDIVTLLKYSSFLRLSCAESFEVELFPAKCLRISSDHILEAFVD